MRSFPRHRLAIALTLFVLVPACAPAPEPPDHSARFKVLGAVASYDREGWSVAGSDAAVDARTRALPFEGVPALRVRPGARVFALLRRTHTKLLVTPFLSWSWYLDYPGAVTPPVHVIVGFAGGRRQPGQPPPATGVELPGHDRRLELVWSASALQRGSLFEPDRRAVGRSKPGDVATRRYAVRGGRENATTWWLETVDLAGLYARAWPQDNQLTARIAFYGLLGPTDAPATNHANGPPATVYLSGFALSR